MSDINKDVVRGTGIPNYSNAWESISMSIYSRKRTSSTFYRRLYEKFHGPIPLDDYGRSYDIHHRDGNSHNNSPENLIAVSIQEHYDIHYSQGDWAACLSLSKRMDISQEKKSELAKRNAASQVARGIHPWQNSDHQREKALKQVMEGKHPWQNSENAKQKNLKRIEENRHNLVGGAVTKKQLKDGTHPSKIMKTCEHCSMTVSSPMYSRWHGVRCKNRNIT